MSDATTVPLADTRDMVGLHRVFREAFAGAAPFIGSAAADPSRVELVAGYYANVLDLLRAHHEGEDELLWPRLVARVPVEAATVERIAAQHDAIHDALDESVALLAAWQEERTADSGARLAAAIARLGVAATAHFDEEERVILPLAATCITAPEWGELPQHGFAAFRGDKVWLILGLIQEQMTAEQVAEMEDHMPPPVVEFWRSTGRRMFQEYVAALRG
jgi:hemerythrin-like domain-containing protein